MVSPSHFNQPKASEPAVYVQLIEMPVDPQVSLSTKFDPHLDYKKTI
jgi:hypothetical protein